MPEIEILGSPHGDHFVLGTMIGGWHGLDVVRFHAREELSKLYEVDIVALRSADLEPVDLDQLLDTSCSLRIRTATGFRVIHGIVGEAEEAERTRELNLYRLRLVPHFERARHRVRCRTFVEQTLEEILVTVLENRATPRAQSSVGLSRRSGPHDPLPATPPFESYLEPQASYRLAVTDMARLRDRELRRYVVQYNESDFDFLSRLLEEEGLGYYFDHEASRTTLTITDRPGFVPLSDARLDVPLRGDMHGLTPLDSEVVRQLRRARRLRSRAVTVRDWDEIRPHRVLEASSSEDPADPEVLGRCEFPGRDEGNVDTPDQVPAQLRLERQAMERELAEGHGNARLLEPGRRFMLHDQSGLREDEDLVVTAVETYATQRKPEALALDEERFGFTGTQVVGQYENRFAALPAHVVFRPAIVTVRPRVQGVHAAVVSADEMGDSPEIHCNEDGWVRLRFPWDQRREKNLPSSCWVRASQGWAGAGFGAMYIPRVGQEVLVAYYQGDVERPVIVGRVYNTIQPVPYALPERKTVSTLKSQSSPGGDGYNELRFEDKKGEEEVYLQAEKNLNELVKASHSNSVGGDQSYSVGGNQKFDVKGNQINTVIGTRAVHVGGMQHMTQKGFTSDAENDHAFTSTNASFSLAKTFEAIAQVASFKLANAFAVIAPMATIEGANALIKQAESVWLEGGKARLSLSAGSAKLWNGAGASISLVGGLIKIDAPAGVVINGATIQLDAKTNVNLKGGSEINGVAPAIKLNG